MADAANEPLPEPEPSRLPDAKGRFVSLALSHALHLDLRTPKEFLHAFPAAAIMHALADHPTRRAHILEKTVGLRPRIGLRKSPESSGEDLQIALDEGETDAAALLELFEPDDRVRFLDPQALWTFIAEPRYGGRAPPPDELERVVAHTAFILNTAIDEELLTGPEILRAISVQTIVQHMPRDEVAAVIETSIADGEAITEGSLLEALGIGGLCQHVPLSTIWEWVIGAKLAVPLGLATDNEPLFDEREAHPDASQSEVTVILDPSETQPNGKIAAKEG